MKKFLVAAMLFGLGMLASCTAQTIKADAKAGVAWIKSASLTAKGALAVARSDAPVILDALQVAKDAFPPGSDLSALDDEAQAAVKIIQTSTDKQLVELAVDKVIAKVHAK